MIKPEDVFPWLKDLNAEEKAEAIKRINEMLSKCTEEAAERLAKLNRKQ